MRKEILIVVALTCLLSLNAFAGSSYKALGENPPEEGSALAVFLLFAEACEERNIESMKQYGGSTYKFMLENSPAAVDHLNDLYGKIDFERPFLYRITETEDGALLRILCFLKGADERKNIHVNLKNDDDAWSVGS